MKNIILNGFVAEWYDDEDLRFVDSKRYHSLTGVHIALARLTNSLTENKKYKLRPGHPYGSPTQYREFRIAGKTLYHETLELIEIWDSDYLFPAYVFESKLV